MMNFLFSERHREQSLILIGALSEKLMARNMRIGVAESCTGGLIAALCTEIPGSSRWFVGGVVAYANNLKSALLGVNASLLEEHGAVSAPVVEAMARGALDALGVDLCVSLSGSAGPDGGSAEKPVGTVWIGAALRHARKGHSGPGSAPVPIRIRIQAHLFPGGRTEVRSAAVLAALEAAMELLDEGFRP